MKSLSGGERNRVILARLFTKPTNFLILDEPTNDLDVETLEVLEDRLDEYKGTLIVVSHDRMFLDSVVTSVFAFEPRGHIERYVGGYNDWLRQGRPLAETDNPHVASRAGRHRHQPQRSASRPHGQVRKLSYKDQRELDSLSASIEALEAEIKALERQTCCQRASTTRPGTTPCRCSTPCARSRRNTSRSRPAGWNWRSRRTGRRSAV